MKLKMAADRVLKRFSRQIEKKMRLKTAKMCAWSHPTTRSSITLDCLLPVPCIHRELRRSRRLRTSWPKLDCGRDAVDKSPLIGGANRVSPSFIEPMKALPVQALSAGKWLYEVKFDGYRALAFKPGKAYGAMKVDDMVVFDFEENIVEDFLRPCPDTPTHCRLSQMSEDIRSIPHVHSRNARAPSLKL
jgi:class II aldolase/adducin N-terminal domain-containing protein